MEILWIVGAEPPAGCKLTLGYKEDVQDLRSSTEELDLQDPVHEQDLKRESKRARKRKDDGSQSDYSGKQLQDRERKDSNCSEICLLNISGRTSRLSSVGSQGSGVSGKLSVVSATSSRYTRNVRKKTDTRIVATANKTFYIPQEISNRITQAFAGSLSRGCCLLRSFVS